MKFNKIISILLFVVATFSLFGCANTKSNSSSENAQKKSQEFDEKTLKDPTNPVVTITMENGDIIKIELYPKLAPNTVNNFIYLANSGFYNGLTFHRVIPKFMIQGGCPKGDGTGNPGYKIKGEFDKNGFPNGLKHTKGVISMARSQDNDSAGSQFFIMADDAPNLDGEYAAFGRVVQGMDVVEKIVSVDRDNRDKPKQPQVMKQVIVDLFGKKYNEPEKLK